MKNLPFAVKKKLYYESCVINSFDKEDKNPAADNRRVFMHRIVKIFTKQMKKTRYLLQNPAKLGTITDGIITL